MTRISRKIERASRNRRKLEQRRRLRSSHPEFECVLSRKRPYRNHRSAASQIHRSRVAVRIHALYPCYCTRREESSHLLPIIGRPECQFQRDIVALVGGQATSPLVTHL